MSNMIKCKACGEMISDTENFCPECGKPVERILDQYMEPRKSSDVEPISGMKGNNILGNLDVAGTKITTDAYSEDHSIDNSRVITDNSSVQSTVYNQTVIDESKKTVTCEVSGRKVLVTNSCQCPSCGRTVATQCFLSDKLRCTQCENDAEVKYKDFYSKLMQGGGVLDAAVRDILDKKSDELKLSEKQRGEIEFVLRKTAKKQLSTKLSGIRLKEFERIIQLLAKSEISADVAISKLRDIRQGTQDDNLLYVYYILLAHYSPSTYFAELNDVNVDVYWQQYWAFMAALQNGSVENAANYIDSLKDKYVDKSNDINLAEVILLNDRYEKSGDDSYLSDLKSNLKLLISIDSRQLDPIYKSLCEQYLEDTSIAKSCKSLSATNEYLVTKVVFPHIGTGAGTTPKKSTPTNAAKGVVLDDMVATPLIVEPVDTYREPSTVNSSSSTTSTNSKSSKMALIAIAAAIIVVVGAFLLWNQGSSSALVVPENSEITKSEEPQKVSNANQNSSSDSDAKSMTTSTQTVTTTASTTKTMASKSSSNSISSSQNSQATDLFNQAENAYKSEDYETAVKLYTSSANLGSKSACLKLSEIYTSGAGSISANAMRAKMWSDKARKLH